MLGERKQERETKPTTGDFRGALLRKCTAEFLGTFAIVFGGCGAIASQQLSGGAVGHVGISLCFGLVVMTMIYAMGHISGAHFNPAVTIAFFFNRHFSKRELAPYLLAQCAGAICASWVHKLSLSSLAEMRGIATLHLGVTQPADGSLMTVLVWESLLTFFLMLVIMAVATDYRAVGQAAGLAIGATVGFEALFAGPITGASMNPARSLGPALVGGDFSMLGGYLLAPIVGASLGGITYRWIRCDPAQEKQVKGCC